MSYGLDDVDDGSEVGRSRFRSPAAPIDRLVIGLGAVAVLAGLIALFGSMYGPGSLGNGPGALGEGSGTVALVDHGRELRSWQLAALLAAFAGLVASSFAAARRVRQVSSLLMVGLALAGFVAWWWTAIGALLGETYVATGHVALSGGIVFSGIALGLQIAVGVVMFMAAFPLSADPSARRTS